MAVRKSKPKVASSASPFEHLNLELKQISPMTDNQALAFNGFADDNCMLLLGSAGTGKSFLGIYNVLRDIQFGRLRKLIIVRSAVSSRDIGHLPGTLEEKTAIYTEPYINIVNELFGRADAWGILVKHGIIEFMVTSFIRGITLDHCGIVFDEIQNATFNELSTIITRAGKYAKVHFVGDFHQSDLKERDRALHLFTKILDRMPEFRSVIFTIEDCVRSGLAKSFLVAQHHIYGDKIMI